MLSQVKYKKVRQNEQQALEVFLKTYKKEANLQELLKDVHSDVIIALVEGAVVGMAHLVHQNHFQVFMQEMLIEHSFESEQLSFCMVDFALEYAKQKGFHEFSLEQDFIGFEQLQLFENMGFCVKKRLLNRKL